jgi:hypothetical protein
MIRKGVWTRGSGKLALLLLVVAAPPAIALLWPIRTSIDSTRTISAADEEQTLVSP